MTTYAYRRMMADAPSIDPQLHQLAHLKPGDREAALALSAEIRRSIERVAIPEEVAQAINGAAARLGER